LINILTRPKNALVKQYAKIFRMEGAEVEFTTGALEMIAERALKRDTGARALRAVCEEIMLDMMYKLPDQAPGGKYIINEAVVEGRVNLFDIAPERRKQSA
jgi:ATP-dependent Clp protease ATP-binding subunit ClpX